MKFLFFFPSFFLLSVVLNAQSPAITDRFNAQYGSAKISPQSQMYSFDNTEVTVKGFGYLDTLWHKGEIVFYPDGPILDKNSLTKAEDMQIRWDIYRNEVDVLLTNVPHAAPGISIYQFSYSDNGKTRVFRNVAAIIAEKDRNLGFYEVLTDGKLLLLKKHEVKLEKPTFNPALNIGDKDYVFKKTDILYSAKNRVIEKLKLKESYILEELMPNQKEAVQKYIADNKLNLKKESHLINTFNQYNVYCGKTK